jgi:sodium/potassium-transporting ATPase subunit alpha
MTDGSNLRRTLSFHVDETQRVQQKAKSDAAEGECCCNGALLDRRQTWRLATDIASLDFHRLSVDELFRRLSTSGKTGLDSQQAQRRLATNGFNKLSAPPRNLFKKSVET